MSDKRTNLRSAIMDLARGIDAVFKKYTKSTREKAWEKITSGDGEREIKKIMVNPNRQLDIFGKLVNQRESAAAGTRIWLDDERPMPDGFDLHIKTSCEAIRAIREGGISLVSLDHDLGEGNGTGYEVAKYIEEAAFNGALIPMEVRVHSANPVGRDNIRRCIDNAKRYWGAS